METVAETATRWRRLRDLRVEQLSRFESGALTLHVAGDDVTGDAIARVKKSITDFDAMIARSAARSPREP